MSNLDASSPADPQVLTLFQEELARAGALPARAATGPLLWPRFSRYYQGLARLPRKMRRALQRRWRRSLAGLALLCALGQVPALAATITVGGSCTLVDAITAANTDVPAGGCAAGSGADTVLLPSPSTPFDPSGEDIPPLTTVNNNTYGPTGLPVITSEITIDGKFTIDEGIPTRSTIARDGTAPAFRILAVGATGNLRLLETTVSGGVESIGGGIFNAGTMTLGDQTTVSNNTADYGGGGISNTGTMTLGDFSTVSGNTADFLGGGIYNAGTMTLGDLSTVSGNTANYGGGGIFNTNTGTMTLTDSTVSGNTASGNRAGGSLGGGIFNDGTMTLGDSSTVSGNTTDFVGGGIFNTNTGTMTLTDSTVSGNTTDFVGGGIFNGGTLTLTNSTVSANTAGSHSGGVENGGLMTVTNSTLSGNSAGDRGGGVNNIGTLTLTTSTISGNASGRVGGGLFNTGAVTLVQSLLSGNSAPVIAPEAYNGSGTVISDNFNLFGHDGFSGVAGFMLGATDLVPSVPLPAILDSTLSNNGGPTQTHGLVFGSPAVDTVPGTGCATAIDQRGAPRPQDADGDTFADCDSGAVERGLIPIQAEITNTTLDCNSTACRVSVRCNLLETQCINPIDVAVLTRARRASDGTLVKASKLIRFATGTSNVPPGGTQQLRVKLTKRGKRFVQATKKRRLKGVLGIQEIATTVTNAPVTISRTDVTIRLKRQK